jgi:hypothetical protein
VPQPGPDAATVPQPEPAVVPQPDAATSPRRSLRSRPAPAGSGETGGQPTIAAAGGAAAPRPARPARSARATARRAHPHPPNATEALNTASLAAARKGENFVPGAPSGPALAAALQEPTTPDEAAAYSDARGPSGGPTGPQLAVPLQPDRGVGQQPPGSEPSLPATPIATTGQQAQPSAPSQPGAQQQPGVPSQEAVNQAFALAAKGMESRTQGVRAQAAALKEAATAAQRRIDHFESLRLRREDQQTARDDRAADRADTRADSAANRRAAYEAALAGRNPMIEKGDRPEDRRGSLLGTQPRVRRVAQYRHGQ